MPLPATLREAPLELRVRAGSPAPVLAEAARGAALLVVGHGGRGMVGRAVLGSTALRVLSLASCPVLVDRPREAADGPVVVEVNALPIDTRSFISVVVATFHPSPSGPSCAEPGRRTSSR